MILGLNQRPSRLMLCPSNAQRTSYKKVTKDYNKNKSTSHPSVDKLQASAVIFLSFAGDPK